MKIAEIFYSIQGEGMLAGVPSVFVRVSGCNLRCVWCDTPYTSWEPEGQEMAVDAIAAELARYPAFAHAVITGGEPMLFPAVADLAARLKAAGRQITIETAGTVYQPVQCDLMSISPKLSSSTPHERDEGRHAAQHERLRYQPEVFRRLMAEHPYQLKFVITAETDLAEVNRIVAATRAERERVLLMPEGTTAEIVRERGRWLAELCKREGFRYSPRLHVDLWGARRGV